MQMVVSKLNLLKMKVISKYMLYFVRFFIE